MTGDRCRRPITRLHDQQRRRAQLQVLPRLRDAEGEWTGTQDNTNTYKVVVVASDERGWRWGRLEADMINDVLREGHRHGHRRGRAGHDHPVGAAAPGWCGNIDTLATLNDDDATADANHRRQVEVGAFLDRKAGRGPILTATTAAYTPLGVDRTSTCG